MKRFFEKASKPFSINFDSDNKKGEPVSGSSSGGAEGNATRLLKKIPPKLLGSSTTTPGLKPRYVLPAVPHPCPYDHLAILVTHDGLLVRPCSSSERSKHKNLTSTHLKICWKDAAIVEVEDSLGEQEEPGAWGESVVVYGIVGMLELFSCTYLLVISSRTEVGHVLDPVNTVYGLKGVTAIPLVEDRAREVVGALAARNAALARPSLLLSQPSIDSTSPDDLEVPRPKVQFALDDDVRVMTPTPLTPIPSREGAALIERPPSAQSFRSDISSPSSENSMITSPVFKTLATRLSFWNRLSTRPPSVHAPDGSDSEFQMTMNPSSMAEERETLDKLMENDEPAKVVETIVEATAPAPITTEEKHNELEEKVVRECIKELTKGGMYWAYTFDITRSLQHKQEQIAKSQKQQELLEGLGALPSSNDAEGYPQSPKYYGEKVSPLAEPNPTLPLWRRVDRQFWWNEWISKPFIDAGLHSYVLPIMQGYFQPAVLSIPPGDEGETEEVAVEYIIISRRSRHRAGLRYQRRGVDDEAQVANFVETETIMRVERDKRQNTFSYVQIRGSIPLFWTQSGYSLKPPPVLAADRTHQQNLDALSRHFKRTIPIYGPHTIINLAEQSGREGAITQAYREYVVEFDNKDVQYCEYDFHQQTKGMKYENISKLVETMERNFEAQGWLWMSDDTVLSHQKGVFRVNCIDCLDRTNVVQSAFAKYVFNRQLRAVALNPANTELDTELIFNDVWANNGDAVSRAYAGTSALKGDFTRTGKRDLSGMLNDGMNSLARMYTATFSDWFCQAVLDFMLGSRTKSVFSEFLLKLQSTDPRDLIRLSKIRAEAIATSVSRVLPEGETLISGWTLFAPEELSVRVGLKFEEKVLLLTIKALYVVSYDYTLEKVKLYTRVPLGDVVGITKAGAYILSPLEEASRDPEQNYGFVISWLTSRQESRASSYSVRNDLDLGVLSNPSSPVNASFNVRRGPPSPNPRSPAGGTAAAAVDGAPLSPAMDRSFAAFKVLPIDPARTRRTGSAYSEMSDEMQASTCKEAAELIVETVQRACEDVGSGGGQGFVSTEDIVSLAEAQRMTSVYAKMEYGLKRLLWLGG
ncbi:hypothetical protein FA15DRAFT_726049 [Coprinopsis marcescibilis]|uniref:Phosphatidylinositide phosphatase SAC2 n=1 Tax=Coprinopsis marcescibilis TaxID=230819 RepID=A0A5C3LBZ1_COPMA|nr:hypothetical protein FA15DRAFT_726049 [Coprinopsis marcescibilis]